MRHLKGIVVSNKMQKTVIVRVDRLKKHPRYHKYYRISKRFKAHDEAGEYKTGDVVIIEETRPYSRGKRWTVKGLLKREAAAESELPEEQS
ncbi:MAG: 30S ribosomal protein S17 [Candidatus Sungiibacteriota bacterium]|uniref:Small ribosomal subunit protein uS17 n=1 Tax=Candidatus Sungiibacteriota bacterium TaxID=2750080 RepID=A0A7T5RJ23_9BACT|nr:MAG: 30S ribosomal protein S17 [Candidatus Sungbacteria bacterium]